MVNGDTEVEFQQAFLNQHDNEGLSIGCRRPWTVSGEALGPRSALPSRSASDEATRVRHQKVINLISRAESSQ